MEINKMANEAFMAYSMEVIKQRAIPSIGDGCKPIHRRVLYGMQVGGYISKKPTYKSAKVVGEIMGNYHPHGDSSVYDALIRLSQPWKMRYPLVFVQGNNGSIFGDKPAHMRYTECKLTPIGELMCNGIKEEAVPMESNYSGELVEPIVLPSEFPNVLVNPNLGIAVGMSSTTVPHNLKEVCDALIAFIRLDEQMTPQQLMNYVKGPDFPTGGTIINGEEIADIYAAGKGSIKLRANYKVENIDGKPTIIIKEVPYLISIEDKIYDKVKKMVTEDGYQYIENIQNCSGNQGFEIRIICTRDANVNKVIKDLCEQTGFQTNISINNTVLVNGVPRQLTFLDMIREYVHFRHYAVINIAEHDRKKCLERIHIIEGLLVAIADIDNVIAIIKASASKDEARQKLIARYNFSIAQVNAILDMRLSRLTNLETVDLQTECGELQKQVEKDECIINNTNKTRDNLLISQFNQIKTKYGDARRTVITSIKERTENAENKPVLHLIISGNRLLAIEPPKDKVVFNKKGTLYAKDKILFGYQTMTNGTSYLFDKQGKIIPIDNFIFDINAASPLNYENIVAAIDKLEGDYLITVTKNGVVKKSKLSEYEKISKVNTAVKIREDDELVWAGVAKENEFLYLLGTSGGLAKIKVSEINTTGKNTIGSKGIADTVICATVAAEEDKLFTIADGKAKFTLGSEYNITGKGSKGQTIGDHTTVIARVNKPFYVVENGGKLIYCTLTSFATKGKTALGAKLTENLTTQIIV